MGVAMPMKATFFITYVMVDGWAGIAAEIIRIVPLILFHLKNTFLVKTEKDRQEATDPGCINFSYSEPRIQLYFLLGLVYSAINPLILPFIVVFFAFAYVVYRHQVHFPHPTYESLPRLNSNRIWLWFLLSRSLMCMIRNMKVQLLSGRMCIFA